MSVRPHDPTKPPRRLPDFSRIQIEDGAPVDNRFQELQMRLLTESLEASWPPAQVSSGPRAEVFADVGLFYDPPRRPPIVPDVMLSLDLPPIPEGTDDPGYNTYSVPHRGKPPDLCIEIVSNRKGGEFRKLALYAEAHVPYVVIFDPKLRTSRIIVRAYTLRDDGYHPYVSYNWFEDIGLGLKLWQGSYGPFTTTWLRWCDAEGKLLPTGKERAEVERQRAEAERQRAETERQRAEVERQRADTALQQADSAHILLETERERAQAERARAEAAEAELARLRTELERTRPQGSVYSTEG